VHIVTTKNIPVVPEWTLTDRLRKAREQAGLTQQALAVAIGVTKQTVSRAERGEGITHRTLLQWAAATDVPVEWINAGSTCACTTCVPVQAVA
jgi:transcriptional regulator with XRE-family HTH domain